MWLYVSNAPIRIALHPEIAALSFFGLIILIIFHLYLYAFLKKKHTHNSEDRFSPHLSANLLLFSFVQYTTTVHGLSHSK